MLTRRYIMAVDLGEVKDNTAIVVLEALRDGRYRLMGLERMNGSDCAVLDFYGSGGYYDRLQRMLHHRLTTPGLPLYRQCYLAVDGTGIGRDVTKRIIRSAIGTDQRAGVPIYPFQIRAAETRSRQVDSGFIQVSRRDLFNVTQYVLTAKRFVGNDSIPLWVDAKKELLSARIKETRGKDAQDTVWRVAAHDDLALALSMGIWLGEKLAGQGAGGIVPVRYA